MSRERNSLQRKGNQYAQDQSNGPDRGRFWVGTAAVAQSALPDLAGLRVQGKHLQLSGKPVEVGICRVHAAFIVSVVSVHLHRQPVRLIAQLLRTEVGGEEVYLDAVFGSFG